MALPETPVLTKQQQKNTLSGKKNVKREKRGRIMFASPYDTYWPLLRDSAETEFNDLLMRCLEPLKRPTVKVKWSELRKVPREQRHRMKQSGSSDHEKDSLRKCLFLGVNAVTRGLESAAVACVLIAKDADPKLLVSHIPTMCGMQGVPVLIVPALRSVVEKALGFSCLTLAVKKTAVISKDDHFHDLQEATSTLSGEIPVPEPLTAFRHALNHKPETYNQQEPSTSPQLATGKVTVREDVYKYRNSRKVRAFIPDQPTAPQPSTDFLSIDVDMTTSLAECMDVEVVPEFQYRPLRLKQLMPNPKKRRK